MNDKVAFTAMDHATREEYDLVFRHEADSVSGQADRVLAWLGMMDGDSPYQISRLDHCLQSATRAQNDGADEETIVCALVHDIGDVIAPANHSAVAAAILRPYVSEKNWWIVEHHGLFQGYYWLHHYQRDRDARDRYLEHPHYQACVDFCERWDQCSFDPNFPTLPLEHFEPMVRAIFSRPTEEYV
jgi:predicted HD phosphohydrolase